jgi:hypothetical protein
MRADTPRAVPGRNSGRFYLTNNPPKKRPRRVPMSTASVATKRRLPFEDDAPDSSQTEVPETPPK